MIPGRISGWHINPKDPATVLGYRANEKGELLPYTTIVAEVPGYNTERDRIANVIAASEEAADLIATLQRTIRHAEGCTRRTAPITTCSCGLDELDARCKAYLKLTR
jgi:hypothetical protein